MPVIGGLLLLSSLLFHLRFTETSSSDDYTCDAGNFTAGRPASVTCHFGPGVHTPGYHFEIVRYPFLAAASHSGEDVLRCHRLGSELRCTTGKGYTFDEKVEDNLTISIPNVTHHQAGRYACQLIPPDNRKKRLCILNVQDAVPSPESLVKSGQSSDTVLVLAVFVGILFVLFIIFLLLFVFRKRRRRNLKRRLFYVREKITHTADATEGSQYEDEEFEVRTPFIMPSIVPYPETEEECEPDDDNKTKGMDGDEEDANPKYKVDISLNYEVDNSDTTDDIAGKDRYRMDEDDKGREAVKITIQRYDEKGKDQPDQVGHDPPRGIHRRPRRLVLPRSIISTTSAAP